MEEIPGGRTTGSIGGLFSVWARMFSWKPVVANPTVQEITPALVQVLIVHPLSKRNPYIFGAVYVHIVCNLQLFKHTYTQKNCIFYLKL